MARGNADITIQVLSGLHAGAVQAVAPGVLRIGGGAGADLVLADDGLAPVHVELEFGAGLTLVQAVHPGVALNAGELEPGVPAQVRLPASLRVAGVELRCEGPASPGRPPWRRRVVQLPALTLCAFAGLALLGRSGMPALANLEPMVPAAVAATIPGAATAVGPSASRPDARARDEAVAPAPALSPAVAAALLQAELSQAGLAAIKVAAQDRLLVASGLIAPADAPRWQSVRESFDRATGGHVPLRNAVEARADRPVVLRVDSVWTGTVPNIILGGAKYLEGSMLPNGWTLERIGDGRLTLRRGEQQVLVGF